MSKLGYRMVHYADDFVILCQAASQAQAALEEVKAWVQENGLSLHPDKTHIGDCLVKGQGFEFLGYRFEAGERWVPGEPCAGKPHARFGGRGGCKSFSTPIGGLVGDVSKHRSLLFLI